MRVSRQHANGLVVQGHGLAVVSVVDHLSQLSGQVIQEGEAAQQAAHPHQLVHLQLMGWLVYLFIYCFGLLVRLG
jgi:hypothetical protein